LQCGQICEGKGHGVSRSIPGSRSTGSLAIACASGGFKGVFAHGVLSAFESAGLRADAYAASSASVASTGFAAIGAANEVGVEYWLGARRVLERPGAGMSDVVLQCIADYAPMVRAALFQPDTPRLIIAVSAVTSDEAAAQTQTDRARALGRRLLVAAARGDRSWVDAHLALHLFDTAAPLEGHRLTVENFDAVAYASARMLHAWDVPASVDGRAYVDASYTCACPAREMTAAGYDEVVAVACEPGPLYHDLFRTELLSETANGKSLHLVRPEVDPREMGVDYMDADESGLIDVYRHGYERGRQFLASRPLSEGR
jgi:hypothetical protein